MAKDNVLLFILFLFFISCQVEDTSNQENIDQAIEVEKQLIEDTDEDYNDQISEIIASIPPPIEISALILNQDINYDNKLLHDASNVKKYHDSYSQAFNLGVYGTDLGYTYIYKQTSDGFIYFDCVNKLANELKIEKYFDIQLISKLNRTNNLDSLLTLTTDNFERINNYFIERKTPELSTALVIGGWIESVYLLSSTYKIKPNEELKNKIGEQKISLELLCQILEKHKKNDEINNLASKLNIMLNAYEGVSITERNIEVINSETIFHDDGTMTYISNVESLVEISDKTLNNIISTVLDIRNQLILEL